MKLLNINNIQSGGILTNYYCTSRCRHCLYCCSPGWKKEFISGETASDNFKKIKKLGCSSVHLGGGEPFLDIPALLRVVEEADKENVNIEYIETNSSWYRGHDDAVKKLIQFKNLGLKTLLVSMSPFHNENIPFNRVKGVIRACEETGINVFPWVMGFYDEINSFDDKKTHSLEEYSAKFGANYLESIPSRYWIHNGGRSLNTFSMLYKKRKTGDIIEESGRCYELEDSSHFHLDLFRNYIPGLCSGISIRSMDIGIPLDPEKYPFVSTLYAYGIGKFLDMAVSEFGFVPREKYETKCHICFDIRRFISVEKKVDSIELKPDELYTNIDF